MKVSLILTIRNEKDSIGQFLESVYEQTKVPDEIVIVDSMSTDNTVKIIKKYQKVMNIKLIRKFFQTFNLFFPTTYNFLEFFY